ncbi:hypothetical protein [Haladaptatus sp. DJG-WS-42]|uniref:hypothetical protein n=1 Tax=Haladaptatus sp. DJG-WS-42 TaxID=3120516 RepID=UPI0030CC11EF
MLRCPHDDCGWHAVAPTTQAAQDRLAEHIAVEHAIEVDTTIPEGMVQVSFGDGKWKTVTPEEALKLHRERDDDEA